MIVKVAEAFCSENGNTKGSKGDQTGKELRYRYVDSNYFTTIIRFKYSTPKSLFIRRFKAIVDSKLVGYSQLDRYSLYDTLKGFNYDIDRYIKSGIKTNCDCSSLVMTVIDSLQSRHKAYNNEVLGYHTRNMLSYFNGKGCSKFNVYDNRYSTVKVKKGDILLKDGHTCIVV